MSKQSVEIAKLRAKLKSMEKNMSQAESVSACEKQKLTEEIDQKQTMIDLQNLAMAAENDTLVKEVETANHTETMLQSKLHETHLELIQLSMDVACTREDVVLAIAGAQNSAKEAIQRLKRKKINCSVKSSH